MDKYIYILISVLGIAGTVVAPDPVPTTPEDCLDGQFFAYWEDPVSCKWCGSCADGAICNKTTQLCPNGCQKWFGPPSFCWGYIDDSLSLAHITDGPEVKNLEADRVEVCFYQDSDLAMSDLADYYVYRVQYAKVEDNYFHSDVDNIPSQTELLVHKDVLGLHSNTEYKFRIALYRVWENSEYELLSYSAVTYAKTKCRPPYQTEIVHAVPLPGLTSVYVDWKPLPNHRCDSYNYFKLYYTTTNNTMGDWQDMHLQLTQTSITVYRLTPGLSYLFKLGAKNNAYLGYSSLEVQVNLIEEALSNDPLPMRSEDSDEGEDEDGTLVYIAIAIAAAVGIIVIIGLILSIYVLMKLRNKAADVSNEKAVSNGPPNPPPPRSPGYEGLGNRPDSHGYADITRDPACNPDNPTYDVL